ncbi:MAG TPA: hypothetical protein VIS51_07550 [Solirubrobacterales bacterium]
MPGPAAALQRAEFNLRGDDGFAVIFELRGHRAIFVAGRNRETRYTASGVAAEYITRGNIAHDRVRARFGGRGRIAVRFEQLGETVRRDPPPHCEGAPKVIRRGFFIGTIRFHGERGYTAVDATRAEGKLQIIPPWRCTKRTGVSREARAAAWEEGRPAVLEAEEGQRGRRTLFEVAADRYPDEGEQGGTRFLAARFERRPTMRIHRFAYAFGNEKTFVCDDELTWATVEPPGPFSGSASFLRSARPKTWIGSLSVELPGAGSVPLTGDDYTARFYWGEPEQRPGY